jgi:hypothetical protein
MQTDACKTYRPSLTHTVVTLCGECLWWSLRRPRFSLLPIIAALVCPLDKVAAPIPAVEPVVADHAQPVPPVAAVAVAIPNAYPISLASGDFVFTRDQLFGPLAPGKERLSRPKAGVVWFVFSYTVSLFQIESPRCFVSVFQIESSMPSRDPASTPVDSASTSDSAPHRFDPHRPTVDPASASIRSISSQSHVGSSRSYIAHRHISHQLQSISRSASRQSNIDLWSTPHRHHVGPTSAFN